MADVDFKQVISEAGIPTTESALKTQWAADVAAQGSSINNDSAYSPFWRAMSVLITGPVLWLLDLLSVTVLPAFFLQTASGQFLDLLADGFNITRKPAVQAQGVITFTRADISQAVTIPAGTLVQTASLNGVVYQLSVASDTAFQPGFATVDVPVLAVEAGAAFNLAAGYYSVLPQPIANISAVANGAEWLLVPGANEESDADLRNRVKNQFGTASDFHTDSVYKSLIATFPGVAVDAIYFVHDAPRGPGTANAYVLFDFSAPVAQYLADINAFITDDGHHGHGDDLQVYQMPEQGQVLTATVWHVDFLSAQQITDLKTGIENFINAAFRENALYSPTLTYPYERFSFSKLGQELHAQFPEIHSVDFSLADIVSALWVARLTTLTVTMQVAE